MLRLALTYLLFVAFAFWMGGFSFYFGVVVRIGDTVVGGTEQGFITRQITWWLNIAGLVAIGLMAIHLFFHRSWLLILSLVAVAVTHGLLMYRQSQLEALLDPDAMSVLDPQRFAALHENYEFLSGCQWLAAMIYLGGLLYAISKLATAPNRSSITSEF